MQAYYLDKPKQPLQLRDAPVPAPSADEVLIETTAVAIHPVDLETRSGKNGMLLPQKPPFVPGVDFVGRVVGTDKRVFGYRGLAAMGAFAEQICVPRDAIATVPDGFSDEDAATFPLPALCAMQLVDQAGAGTKRVLVHGGAGGVGSIAVQVFAGLGHEVITTANGRDEDWVKSLGAAEVINYTSTMFEDAVRDVDLVLDTVGGDTLKRSFGVLVEGGIVASLNAMPSADVLRDAGLNVPGPMAILLPLMSWSSRRKARAAGVTLSAQVTVPSGDRLQRAANAVAARGLQTRIAKTLPFESLDEAMDLAASKVRGRIVVTRG